MNPRNEDTIRTALLELTPRDFLNVGMDEIAYIRPVVKAGKEGRADKTLGFALHAADGTRLSMMDSFESALILARENHLVPVTLQ